MTYRRGINLLVAASLLASPAASDWLVTRDGSRIETLGPWQVKGSQVVFTLPGGRLSALRAADVDLEASGLATRAAASAAEAAEAAAEPAPRTRSRRPVRAFTNDNLTRRPDAGPEGDPVAAEDDPEVAEAEPEAGDSAADPDHEPVEIVSWESREDADGLEIVGTLRNTGADFAAAIQLAVTVAGDEDEPPYSTRAFLESSALAPGARTDFRALLPGIFFLPEDPSFSIRSQGFTVAAPSPASEESGDSDGGVDGIDDDYYDYEDENAGVGD